jgi:glycosyltransferase involved in cell wall biosynthesis
MIIGIDIRVLGSPVKSGVEEYTENLLSHMLPLDSKVKYKLFYSSYRRKLNRYNWLSLPNVEVHNYNIPNKLMFLGANFLNKPKVDRLIGGVDTFFSPHFFLTSLSPDCKHAITFHDLSFVRFPEFFSLRKRIWHGLEMKPHRQSRFSDKIITVSQSTKDDLVNLYGLDPARIEVIYSGISPTINQVDFQEANMRGRGRIDGDELKKFRVDNNLPGKFILFLGKFEPRKNIGGLVQAFNILKRNKNFNEIHLVLLGSKGWLYKDIFREIKNSEFRDKIIIRDFVSDKERNYYYSLADIFVYPSFFEGFGFPPLEAITCGTPVVVSANSSLPEVVGRGALMVDPYNIDEIARAMSSILSNGALKDKLVYEGLCRINSFSWKHSAEKTLNYLLR